ncbi:MAG: hypothetical protein OEM76_10440 [Gammaproteobacteria bacterium]|nr:hypothetical protein [Gammaproteobacteria bacterium]
MLKEFESVDDPGPGLDPKDPNDLVTSFKTCNGLPPEVLAAEFSYINDRILDQETFTSLTEPLPEQTSESVARYRRRKLALADYVNKRLICVCIRLPGVLYTVEIDPVIEKVIHWEWQQA